MGFRRMSAARSVAGAAALALLAAPLALAGAAGAAAPGTLTTWGSNGFGQLGNGTTSTIPVDPAAVTGLSGVVDVHGGREHVVALASGGEVYTWGSNQEGQLGVGGTSNRSVPTRVTVPCPGAEVVTAVETGHNSTLALCSGGGVWTWGLNADGQLGNGTTTLSRTPVAVTGLSDAVAIAAGRDMSYAVRAGGSLVAWGDNAFGELGDGTLTDRSTPVAVSGLSNVTGIAAGRNHGLALRSDGSVWAFGANTYGQVGNGGTTDQQAPVEVVPSTSLATEVAAGAHHSYALRSNGQVLSWGRNYRNELGDGTSTMRTRSVTVLGVSGAVSIGSGRDHGLAVLGDGSVKAWGQNANGQLGDGTLVNRSTAVTVPGVDGAIKAGGGGGEYSVVLESSGPAPNQPPTARFTTSCDRLVCSFDASGSSDTDGTIASHSWDFGDQSAPQSGATVTHAFAATGSYTVTLTVTDDDQATGTTDTQVAVSAIPPAAVAFRAGGSYDGSTRTPTVTVPAGVVSGDRMLLFVSTSRNATATTPTGWSRLGSVIDGTDLETWVFSRSAGTETAGTPVRTTLDATSKVTATLLVYAGAAAPSTAVSAVESRYVTGHRARSATVTTAGSTVVAYWVDKTSTTHGWTLPTGLAARAMQAGVAGTAMLTSTAGDASGVAPGTWPGATATAGVASGKAVAWTVVLPPA